MRIGNFSLMIPEGRERGSGHVEIEHGKQYTLKLFNHNWNVAADVEITVDGKPIGGYRLKRGGGINLERSYLDQRRFTAYHGGTADAQAAGADKIGAGEFGTIVARFRPEKRVAPQPTQTVRKMGGTTETCADAAHVSAAGPDVMMGLCGLCDQEEKTSGGITTRGMKPAMTGLSGHSDQEFVEVPELDYDLAAEVVITLRLVGVENGPGELRGETQANQVPRPV
jgi:hypothetical protein